MGVSGDAAFGNANPNPSSISMSFTPVAADTYAASSAASSAAISHDVPPPVSAGSFEMKTYSGGVASASTGMVRVNGVEFPLLNHEVAKARRTELKVYKRTIGSDGNQVKTQYPLFIDPLALVEDLGLGAVFYFRFLESVALIFILGSLVFGIPAVWINFRGTYLQSIATASFATNGTGSGTQLYANVAPGTYTRVALGNQSSVDVAYIIGHALFMLLLTIMTFRLRKQLEREANEIEDATISTSDYSIKIEGLPDDATNPDEIADFCRRWCKYGGIVSVSIAFTTNEVTKIRRMMSETADEIEVAALSVKKLEALGGGCLLPLNLWMARRTLRNAEEAHEKYSRALTEKLHQLTSQRGVRNAGIAYVVFDRSQDSAAMVRDLHRGSGFVRRLLAWCMTKSEHKFRGEHTVRARKAPEPSDVNWEDLCVPELEKRRKAILSTIVLLIITGIALTCLILLFRSQNDRVTTEDSSSSSADQTVINQLVSILIKIISKGSIFVVVFLMNKMDAHHTHSGRVSALVLKCLIIEFSNMGLSPFIGFLTVPTKGFNAVYWYAKTGFLQQVMANFISECILSNFLSAVDVAGRLKTYFGIKNALTQKQLNLAYEPSEFDLKEKYGTIIYNIFMAVFYCVPIPFCLIITAISLIAHYFIDRFTLLRRCKAPPKMDSKLAFELFFYIRFAIFLNLFFCALFYWDRPSSAGNSTDFAKQFTQYIIIFSAVSGALFFYWNIFYQCFLKCCCTLLGKWKESKAEGGDASDLVSFSSNANLEHYIPPLAQVQASDAAINAKLSNELSQIQAINNRSYVIYIASASSRDGMKNFLRASSGTVPSVAPASPAPSAVPASLARVLSVVAPVAAAVQSTIYNVAPQLVQQPPAPVGIQHNAVPAGYAAPSPYAAAAVTAPVSSSPYSNQAQPLHPQMAPQQPQPVVAGYAVAGYASQPAVSGYAASSPQQPPHPTSLSVGGYAAQQPAHPMSGGQPPHPSAYGGQPPHPSAYGGQPPHPYGQ